MSYYTHEQKPGSNLALEEMCKAMTVFASNGDNRETLNDKLQDICVQHGHPFGNVKKQRQIHSRFVTSRNHIASETYEACRFCGAPKIDKALQNKFRK
jgi:hypothetical protein